MEIAPDLNNKKRLLNYSSIIHYMSKITLYIATSSDGFIATKEGSVAWLDKFSELGEDYGYNEFIKPIDIVIMGNTTYEQVLGFGEYPYKGKKGYVFANKVGKDENVTFVNGNVKEFIEKVSGNIWLIGGANIAQQFHKYNLIDKYIIFVMPVELKEGIKLFEDNYKENLILEKKKEFPSGVIEYHYKKN